MRYKTNKASFLKAENPGIQRLFKALVPMADFAASNKIAQGLLPWSQLLGSAFSCFKKWKSSSLSSEISNAGWNLKG